MMGRIGPNLTIILNYDIIITERGDKYGQIKSRNAPVG